MSPSTWSDIVIDASFGRRHSQDGASVTSEHIFLESGFFHQLGASTYGFEIIHEGLEEATGQIRQRRKVKCGTNQELFHLGVNLNLIFCGENGLSWLHWFVVGGSFF